MEPLLTVAGILIFLITLPGNAELLLLTLGALLPQKKPAKILDGFFSPNIAVIIPAHNEEKNIGRTIRSLKSCPDPFSLYVIADNCTDQTAKVASAYQVIVLERQDPMHKGKNFALQFAFSKLLSENFDLFLIVDADTIVGPNLIEEMGRLYREGHHAIQVKYALERPYQSYRDRLLNIAFSAFNLLRPRGRQHWNFSAGILGNGFALSRELLLSVPFQESSIVEDIAYHLSLVKKGYQTTFTDKTAVYTKLPSTHEGLSKQRARWEGGRIHLLFSQFFPLISGIFKGNFRLIEPLLDLLLLPLGYHVALLILLLFIPLLWLKIYALIGLALSIFYTFATLILIRGNRHDYLSLLYAPIYLLQKLAMTGRIIDGAIKGRWERTPRDH